MPGKGEKGAYVVLILRSTPKEIWSEDEHRSDDDEKNRIRDKVGEYHQDQAAHQWNRALLLAAIDEEAEPDGTKEKAPEDQGRAHRVIT